MTAIMYLQIIQILKRPIYAASAIGIAISFSVLFLYFDEFLFFSPYLIFSVLPGRIGYFALDLIISGLSGVVLSLSLFQLFSASKLKAKGQKLGVVGIIVAFISGACPCYYLVPLIAVAGGAGGILAFMGITLSTYQLPVKLVSVALMALVGYSIEKSLRVSCRTDYRTEQTGVKTVGNQ